MIERRPGRGRTVHLRLTTTGLRTHRQLLQARHEAIAALTQTLEPAALQRVAELVAPSLTAAGTDTDRLRRPCSRLCRRSDCDPLSVAAGITSPQTDPASPPPASEPSSPPGTGRTVPTFPRKWTSSADR